MFTKYLLKQRKIESFHSQRKRLQVPIKGRKEVQNYHLSVGS